MKRLVLLAVLVPLLVAASAAAKAVSVDIGKAGFSPAKVTLQAGDSITWTNKDRASHRVVCPSCPFTSQILGAGASYSYTFLNTGKFTVVDPLNRNKKLMVTVKPASAAVTVTVAPAVVTYGRSSRVSGTISGGQAGQKVEIFAFPCLEQNEKRIAIVTTTTGGAFSFQVQPPKLTTYHTRYAAKSGTVSSSSVNISVRPAVTLRRIARGRFTVSVSAAESFVRKTVAIQRFVEPKRRKWITVRTVSLVKKSSPTSPGATAVSSSTFTSTLQAGVRLRAVLPPTQAVPCYLAGRSRVIKT